MQQANNELEKLKMERESVQRAHDAAFDAGEVSEAVLDKRHVYRKHNFFEVWLIAMLADTCQ
eukprot:scaffold119919_cov20-Tisochrysis_lutea.AAC.1